MITIGQSKSMGLPVYEEALAILNSMPSAVPDVTVF